MTGVIVTDANLTLPLENFVHYAYQSRFGNPYGESDLVAAYRPWNQKDLVQRMWLHALDRFGSPIPVARVPASWSQEDIDNLSRLLARLQNESSLVVSDEVTLENNFDAGRVEPARAFHTAADWYDGQIARSILGQELTTQGSSGGGSGSYALGRVHEGVERGLDSGAPVGDRFGGVNVAGGAAADGGVVGAGCSGATH